MSPVRYSWLSASITSIALIAMLSGIASRCADPHDESARPKEMDLIDELRALGPFPRIATAPLTVPTLHAPCREEWLESALWVRVTCAQDVRTPDPRVLSLAAQASALARQAGRADAARVSGLVDLLWADSTGIALDRSISLLETSSRLDPDAPGVFTDLAAAYLTRAERVGEVVDLLAALEAAMISLEYDSTNTAARFTSAVALSRLGLSEEAALEWRQVTMRNAGAEWDDEARLRATPVGREDAVVDLAVTSAEDARAFVLRDPQGARLFAVDSLLFAWGDAVLQDDTATSAQLLNAAEWIGVALAQGGGDRSTSAMTEAIRHARAAQRRELAEAHRAYGRGVRRFTLGDYAGGIEALGLTKRKGRSSPVLVGWADFFFVSCVLHSSPPEWAIDAFLTLARQTDESVYPALAARARWGAATSLNKAGRQPAAIPNAQQAQRLFARIGEREHLGAVTYIEALSRVELRQGATAFSTLRRSLHTLRPIRSSVWLHNVLYMYAQAAGDAGYPRAAERLASEAIAVADRRHDPRVMTESRLGRARHKLQMGDRIGAARDLDSASVLVDGIPAGAARDWQHADLLTLRAISGEGGGGRLASLDSVVAAFREVGTPMKLVPALIARARRAIQNGNAASASRDLEEAVDRLDRARRAVEDREQVQTLVDATRGAFEQLAMLSVAAGRDREALVTLERARSALTTGEMAPSTGLVRAGERQVILNLALIADTLLSWTSADGETDFRRSIVPRREVLAEIERIRAMLELRVHDDAVRPALARLYDRVLRDGLAHVGARDSLLVIIADDAIGSAPLSAAFDTATGQYLVERFTIRHEASLASALQTRQAERAADQQVVLIGDPAFDQASRRGLTRLPGAREEVRELMQVYPRATVFLDSTAFAGAVQRAISQASLLHFAGHALIDERRPDRSELVLASPRDDSGADRLTAAQIGALSLRGTQLVVLSACESSRSSLDVLSRTNGLATAFLAAGVGGVVGSLWRVNDAHTRGLMVRFHASYRAGGDAARALRLAQLEFLSSDDIEARSPSAWAAFRYSGS